MSACRVEGAKLLAQWPTRILPLVCVLGPLAFAIVLRIQPAVPTDTLFGSWVHTSGFAVPLVILGFAGAWVFPVIAGIAGGDMFAGEDRLGTWKTLLTRSSRRSEIFAGKVLIAGAYAVAMVVLLGAASILAGVVATGTQPLVGLSGQVLGSGRALELTVESWAVSLLPALAFTALALLVSAVTGAARPGCSPRSSRRSRCSCCRSSARARSSTRCSSRRRSTPGTEFSRRLRSPGRSCGEHSSALAYAAVFLGVAWLSLRNRDIAGPATGRASLAAPARVLRSLSGSSRCSPSRATWGPTAITRARLERSIVRDFRNLTVLQQE